MANIYVRSTDGNNADSGATWALAKLDLVGAAAIDAAGDTIFVSDNHAESTAGSIAFNLNGTISQPTKVICGDDSAEPPTALATTGTVTSTGTGSISISGSAYIYGLTFNSGTGATNSVFTLGAINNWQVYENCSFVIPATGASGVIRVCGSGVSDVRGDWVNCHIKFGAAGQCLAISNQFHWNGGSVLAGGTSPTVLINQFNLSGAAGGGGRVLIENVDFSNCSASLDLCGAGITSGMQVVFRNCKMPASWSGDLITSTLTNPSRVELYNCDDGATNYTLWTEDTAGTIRDETTIVRTGGVHDGARGISWKMTSTASVAYPVSGLYSGEFGRWNEITGVPLTLTVEIIHDSATAVKDDEVSLEVLSYPGSSSSPQGSRASSLVAYLTTSANLPTSSETWGTTGMANPNKQYLTATITPQMAGYIICRVWLYKASKTIYVDYFINIST